MVSEGDSDIRVFSLFLWQGLREDIQNGRSGLIEIGKSKDIKNIVAFYREWKLSSHYKIYLHHKKLVSNNSI